MTGFRALLPGFRIGGRVAFLFAERHIHDVLERIAVEDVCDGVADINHEHAQAAVDFIRAGAFLIFSLAGAADGGQFAVDETDHVAHLDGIHGLGEPGAAVLAAHAFHVTRAPQFKKNGLQELERQLFLQGQAGNRNHALLHPFGNAKPDQGAQRIFASFRQFHFPTSYSAYSY